jgi:hypothetical protein
MVVTIAIVIVRMAVLEVTMMMVVAAVNVILAAMVVGMQEKPRKRASRRNVGHGNGRRHGEHQRHHPGQGGSSSASSFQVSQHAFRRVSPDVSPCPSTADHPAI